MTTDGRLALWGAVPLRPGALYPVHSHLSASHDPQVVWPSFLERQPPGFLTLPAMGSTTSALLMMLTLPPSATPTVEDQENASENFREMYENCGEPSFPRAGGVKRKGFDADLRSDSGGLWKRSVGGSFMADY